MLKTMNAGILCALLLLCLSSATWAAPQGGSLTWVADAAEKVLPSVVNISSTKKVKVASPFANDPFFRNFFGDGMPQERIQRSLGSGVIVSRDGYIVTNNHVVGDADVVEVRLADERVFTAKLIGADPKSDVAVIRIDARNLPVVRLGDSSKLKVGNFVIAVGNPFGLEGTVTHGIISALGRTGLNIGVDYENFIQTDAPINPGNSGGALVNTEGELIGINTAILSGSGTNVGIGFAIPVNLAMNIVRSIEKTGKVVRGWMGVTVQEVTPAIAKAMGIKPERVEELKHMLAKLYPWPGLEYSSDPPQYVMPDVTVEKTDNGYEVYLSNESSPELRISHQYRAWMRKEKMSKDEKKYLRDKIESAKWLIRNIEQRQNTILRIARAIVDVQQDFLEKGVEAIKPLTLQEIADAVGVHEATVSRATRGKYMQTPQGLFEMKYFFSPGLKRDTGDAQSSKSVQSLIKKMIDEEDKTRPLSDQKIANVLKKQGINIARRTVTKYRENMDILPTTMRRIYQESK